uniref:Uncharacterized protein n=1 Tax=Tetraselmis sp. GSL018 TaxID=582737 RepID=A0A061S880_9CHLO
MRRAELQAARVTSGLLRASPVRGVEDRAPHEGVVLRPSTPGAARDIHTDLLEPNHEAEHDQQDHHQVDESPEPNASFDPPKEGAQRLVEEHRNHEEALHDARRLGRGLLRVEKPPDDAGGGRVLLRLQEDLGVEEGHKGKAVGADPSALQRVEAAAEGDGALARGRRMRHRQHRAGGALHLHPDLGAVEHGVLEGALLGELQSPDVPMEWGLAEIHDGHVLELKLDGSLCFRAARPRRFDLGGARVFLGAAPFLAAGKAAAAAAAAVAAEAESRKPTGHVGRVAALWAAVVLQQPSGNAVPVVHRRAGARKPACLIQALHLAEANCADVQLPLVLKVNCQNLLRSFALVASQVAGGPVISQSLLRRGVAGGILVVGGALYLGDGGRKWALPHSLATKVDRPNHIIVS